MPYGYSPILLAHPETLDGDKAGDVKKFLKATAEGYAFAAANPAEAAAMLIK